MFEGIRSASGTFGSGVTARMAVDAARGLVGPGGRRRFAGASGVVFEGALLSQEGIGASGTCVVRVSGAAHYTGSASFVVEDNDALADGFAIEDAFCLPD